MANGGSTNDPSSGTERPKRRRFRRIVRRLVIVGIVGYALASYAAAWWLSRPTPAPAGPLPTPSAHDFELTTSDGLTLRGWRQEPTRPGAGVVLLFHGIQGHRFSMRYRWLAERGFGVISVDHRAHGESEGDRTCFGWHEAKDVEAVVAEARRMMPSEKVGAWGASMGGAAILYASEVTRDLDAVVLESVYATIDDALQNRLDAQVPRWLHPFILGPRLMTEWRCDLDADEMDTTLWAKSFDGRRVLMASGLADDRVRVDEAESLHAALPGSTLRLLRDVGHTDLCSIGPDHESWRKELLDFLTTRLDAATPR